ncbi:hypothetical protein LCGC14_3092260 [marine sediment metagenome]|uniref:Uncharacterized protein n=1 Tax=marine sediment metagenome TaxID=412755 RepID=A0A0F8Z0I4_9ZZZZ
MFCPEDGTLIEPPATPNGSVLLQYPPCSGCGTIWRYVGTSLEGVRYEVVRETPTPESLLGLVPTLQAVGLPVITECPIHPGSDHDPFDCPTMEENYEGCPYCGQAEHTKGSCLEPADFEKGEPC